MIELIVAFGLDLVLLFINYDKDIFFEMQLSGVILISLSASSIVKRQEFAKESDKHRFLVENDKNVIVKMIVVAIAISGLLIFLSLFGLCGAFGEKKCLISFVSSCLHQNKK